MHHRSLSELQGVSSQQGTSPLRTTQDRASSWGSRLRKRGSARCCLSPPRAAPLWVWLLLGALVVPGAWSFLSEEQEELLVELHNHYRGQVSPSASAMMPLKWDPSLKVIAEGYAAKCVWNHNPDLEETGENLYAGTKPLDHREALEEWFLEHLNYDFNNNSCDEDKMCGHYTQMVWADTHRVGCAMHVCNDMEGLNWGMAYFLVCNYYPAGNYEGERPYVEGDWCSRCPENLQKCENNLCVDDTVEEIDEDVDEEEEEEEDVTDIPMTTEPFLLPDQELKEEEAVLPPPATTDAYVPPPTTTAPSPAAPTTPDPPRMNTDAADHSEEVEEEIEITPAPATVPPRAPPTTPGPHEEVDIKTEEEEEEEGEEEVVKEVKEEQEKRQPARKAEIDVIGKIFQKQEVTKSSGSVCSSSVLLAGLMMILNLRL